MDSYIKIQIDQHGQAVIEAVGMKGGGCKDATQLHEEIYDEVIDSKNKPELYEGASCPVQQISV
jgi:hypothetical protein